MDNKFSYHVFVLMLALSLSGYAAGGSADFNGDGVVNFSDFAQYDFYHDGILDLDAIELFAQDWLGSGSYISPDTNRMHLSFNVGWKFYKGAVSGDTASGSSYDDSSWLAVNLPHNPPKTGQSGPDAARPPWTSSGYSYEGVSWYRKHFTLDNSYQGRKIFLEFEAVGIRADVWVNGTLLTTHYGGYLPFTIDMTDYVNFGGTDNVIAVKADNTDDASTPIGNATWFNWAGIYRDVWLHITDKLHVTDAVYANTVAGGGVFVTYPSANDVSAQVQVKTNVKNEYATSMDCTVKTYIVDANNLPVAQMADSCSIAAAGNNTFTQLATVTSPRLWHPDHPNLYTVYTEVYDGDGSVDTYKTRAGIRSISFSKAEGFKINGQALRFRGANRLQDFPYIGYAMGNVGQRRDAEKLKEAGFQCVRTSHYAQDPAFMEACDELGIMIMDEIPGFQWWDNGGSTFTQRSYQNMKDMMRRDRNHPCVIAWELSLNETGFNATYANMAYSYGHAEYPGNQCFVAGWKVTGTYYPDIYIATPSVGARTYSGPKPLFISEYGHWEYQLVENYYSDVHRGDIGDGYYGETAMLNQAANHQDGLNQNRGMTYLCGDNLWVGIDYGPYPSGVLDIYRLPKFSYYFFQSQRDPNIVLAGIDSGPMVYIANYWTASSPTTVKVFSNCEQVKLYKNSVLQATQSPDTGTNLEHPPFTFTGLTFTSGQLMAEGLIGGEVVATHTVTTPGTATALSVAFDVNDVPANGSETIQVNASILDSSGTLVPTASSTNVTFSVTGQAALASPAIIKSEAGIATAYIRVTDQPGLITVSATASGLTPGSASITSE
jgi:beta-galactosidase